MSPPGGDGFVEDSVLADGWDGDGTSSPGLFRNGQWLLRDRVWGGSVDRIVDFGRPGDRPVVGDWNGTADSSIADLPGVRRGCRWYLMTDNSHGTGFSYGSQTGDVPVVGRW